MVTDHDITVGSAVDTMIMPDAMTKFGLDSKVKCSHEGSRGTYYVAENVCSGFVLELYEKRILSSF